MILTTDFHTHILPGIDDGSQSPKDSIRMIEKECADGVNTILLTPHFYPQHMYPTSFLECRQQAMERLSCTLPTDMVTPQFILGAEVLFCPGMSQWEELDMLTLGKSQYILIEMPFNKWSDSAFTELKQIRNERGLTPILAHIERYLPSFGTKRFINRLSALPVLLQSNCEFLTDKHTQRIALTLIKEKKIHLIGSDCHSSTWRAPIIAQAREVLMNNLDKQILAFLKNTENSVIQK